MNGLQICVLVELERRSQNQEFYSLYLVDLAWATQSPAAADRPASF
jgi:hypothetical protein